MQNCSVVDISCSQCLGARTPAKDHIFLLADSWENETRPVCIQIAESRVGIKSQAFLSCRGEKLSQLTRISKRSWVQGPRSILSSVISNYGALKLSFFFFNLFCEHQRKGEICCYYYPFMLTAWKFSHIYHKTIISDYKDSSKYIW